MSPRFEVPGWLAEAFEHLAAGDVEGWAKMYAPDAVHELPFAAEGEPDRLEGRAAITATLKTVFDRHEGRMRFGTFENVRVCEAGDEIIFEGDGCHFRRADNTPVKISLIWFITRQNGEVTHLRDYMNPLDLRAAA